MENTEVKEILEQEFLGDEVIVEGDGYHYSITIVSNIFDGLSRVKRTQKVYAVLNDSIQSGALHALSVSAFTSKEWSDKSNG